MELRVNNVAIPEKITFNYEDLKNELTEKVIDYETTVYTDDLIKEAKADKASLNKLKKSLNDERIKREKEYMKPFNEFKAQVNEIIGIIDKPIQVIDQQVKSYEEKRKIEKMEEISDIWNATEHPDDLSLDSIFDEKWLNTSTTIKSIKETISDGIKTFSRDMLTLSMLPAYSFEAQQIYIKTHDMTKAIEEANARAEMDKMKAEAERKAAELKKAEEIVLDYQQKKEAEKQEPIETEDDFIPSFDDVKKTSWISIKALLTDAQTGELIQFFDERNIKFTL